MSQLLLFQSYTNLEDSLTYFCMVTLYQNTPFMALHHTKVDYDSEPVGIVNGLAAVVKGTLQTIPDGGGPCSKYAAHPSDVGAVKAAVFESWSNRGGSDNVALGLLFCSVYSFVDSGSIPKGNGHCGLDYCSTRLRIANENHVSAQQSSHAFMEMNTEKTSWALFCYLAVTA